MADEIEIRTAIDADLPRLTEIYNHYIEHTAFTFDMELFTVDRRREEWFSKYAPTGRHRVLVAIQAGDVVGFTYSSRFRPKQAYEATVETSVYLTADYTGRGLGRRLYETLFQELAREDVHRAIALITQPNEPSESLHRKLGFESAGIWTEAGRKFGELWDVGVWQRPIVLPD